MSISDNTRQALVIAVVGLVVFVIVRLLLERGYRHYERRFDERDPYDASRRRTTWLFVERLVLSLIVIVVTWNVLAQFPVTASLGRALIASSAVLALFAGLAFSTPLSNLGSGLLVAFTQPLRLGDRVTIGAHTGFVETINLIYTTLVTDEALRIFVPNSELTSTTIVNRTIRDPRRSVYATFPIPVGASIDDALAALRHAVADVPGLEGDARVLIGEVGDARIRLEVRAYAPLDADVVSLGSQVRFAGLRALGDAGLLAA